MWAIYIGRGEGGRGGHLNRRGIEDAPTAVVNGNEVTRKHIYNNTYNAVKNKQIGFGKTLPQAKVTFKCGFQ